MTISNSLVKVSPMYDFVRWGVPVRGTLILSHRYIEVGWSVPSLAAFTSPVLPPGTHLLLGGQ